MTAAQMLAEADAGLAQHMADLVAKGWATRSEDGTVIVLPEHREASTLFLVR
jgi:hypothetical protein